jgi:hypothetical protein
MARFYNRVGVATATTGAGTITLGSAIASGTSINACGFQTFAGGGASNGETVSYLILDSNGAWEYGTGTYTSAGTTLSRTLGASSTGSLLNLSGSAQVFITARREDLLSVSETQSANTHLAGPTSGGAATPTFRALVAADIPNMTPTQQYLTSGSGATYTTPANCRKIIVKMIGGGGGGGGSGTSGQTAGGTGGTTSFNSINAAGGGGGAVNAGLGGLGGTGGTGSASLRLPGSSGGWGENTDTYGGAGASGIFGAGAARGPITAGAGTSGGANTGAGGSGASPSSGSVGAGGGAGEYVEIIITSPAATYTYTIGAGGSAGSSGASGSAGGAGGTGLIIVAEYY